MCLHSQFSFKAIQFQNQESPFKKFVVKVTKQAYYRWYACNYASVNFVSSVKVTVLQGPELIIDVLLTYFKTFSIQA